MTAPTFHGVVVDVPPIPAIDGELLDRWVEAHRSYAEAIGRADAALAAPFSRWLRDHTLAALAGIYPSISGEVELPLFPPPRAFLSDRQIERAAGVLEALRYIDVQVTLHRLGLEPFPLRIETPFVIHALVEGRRTSGEETNPAVLRTRASSWVAKVSPYAHPPAETVRPLVERIIQHGVAVPDAAPAVAGWIAFCWMSLHPWVDGNGRTARLLYLLVAARQTPVLDLGAIEQMTFQRAAYTAALQQGQWTTPTWDPALLDPAPFTTLTTEWSVLGADTNRRRLTAFLACAEQIAELAPRLDAASVALAIRIGIERIARPDQLVEPNVEQDDADLTPIDEWLEGLTEGGVLVRRPLPPSRRLHGRAGIGYSVTPPLYDAIGRLLAAH